MIDFKNFNSASSLRDKLNSLYFSNIPRSNFVRSQQNQVYTRELLPNVSPNGIIKLNNQMNKMIEQIKNQYFIDQKPTDINYKHIYQILVHSHNCPHCKVFHPLYTAIGNVLQSQIYSYTSYDVEVNETIDINWNGETKQIKGADLYNLFDQHGVPFVLQNFKCTKNRISSNLTIYNLNIIPLEVKFTGDIPGFRFLSETWEVPNEYVESSFNYIQ